MSAQERESLLKELEAIVATIPDTCGCCPPGGRADHDCNWAWKKNAATYWRVMRDPTFIRGSPEARLCDDIRRYIGYAKERANKP